MVRKYLLPALAVAGIVFAVYVVHLGAKPVLPADPVAPPSESPFVTDVAGAGLVEANTQNIAIGTPVAGVVKTLYVKAGAPVSVGQKLFDLDDRDLQAELLVRKAALKSALVKRDRLRAQPRREDVPLAVAKVEEARVNFDEAENLRKLAESLGDQRAISAEELARRRFAVAAAKAKLDQANADLAELRAGAWKPDLDIADADVASAEAQVQATDTNIARLTVKSPVEGKVLQLNLRLGESAPAGVAATPLLLVGSLEPLHLRVDVDENDAWRVSPQAKARATLRGNRAVAVDLKFEYIEPFVVPKRSLTGDTTERVDTRVLQVVYSFDRGDKPVYIGQQMDVFISAAPLRK